jgi:hypothetical protein
MAERLNRNGHRSLSDGASLPAALGNALVAMAVATGRECEDGSMKGIGRWTVIGFLAVLCSACGAGSSSTAAPGSPTETGADGLRAAATAWSDAFLTGTTMDIRNMEGAQCLPTSSSTSGGMESLLAGMRTSMERRIGTSLRSVRITGVRVRNVTATTGNAEVKYALPASVVGNDNWVSYAYEAGQWKVTNCRAPFGGSSQSPSPAT